MRPKVRNFLILFFFLSFLQLVSCVYVEYVKSHTGCWALQLLSLFCLRQRGYKNKTQAVIDDCVAPDDTGLAMDCACFTFLVMQYRVFTSDYFKHVVRDHKEQADMASRCVPSAREVSFHMRWDARKFFRNLLWFDQMNRGIEKQHLPQFEKACA